MSEGLIRHIRDGAALAANNKAGKARPAMATVWREARDLIRRHRGYLVAGMAILLVNRAASFIIPLSSKFLIDEVVDRRQDQWLYWIVVAVAAGSLVQALTSFALSQVLSVTAQHALIDMRRSVQEHMIRLPVDYFDSNQTGALVSRIMNDADGIRNLVGIGFVQLMGGILTALIALVILFYFHPLLTAANLLVLAAFGGGMWLAFGKLRPLYRQRNKIHAETTGRLTETLNGIRVVKSYSAERREALVFTRGAHALLRVTAKALTGISAVSAFSTLAVAVTTILVILLGSQAMLDGRMSKGDFFLYVLLTGLAAAPIVELASIGSQFTEAFAGLDRIREVKRLATEDLHVGGVRPLGDIRGEVEFQDVSFEYVPGQPVLRGVSFTARQGTTTALVGPSGSGKSTLISLVMSFNRPRAGRILLDGRDLHETPLSSYRARLGVVLQENFLFDGTIAENIAYARPHATCDEIREAAKTAHACEFIDGFPKGFDTLVGERGIRLSGGQRQRISIARAILANPTILILDEATSSLDSESEELIQEGLNALRTGRTTFVIAHRLSTIRSADRILVLEKGSIVEEGTHAELMARDGRYKQLYDKQYKLESNRFLNPGEMA